MRKILIAIAFAWSASAGMLVTRDNGTHVSIDGENVRIDRVETPPILCNVVISRDGGKTSTCLNTELQTWFESEGKYEVMGSIRFGLTLRESKVVKPKVETHDEPGDEIAGHATEKHVIRLSYNLIETYGDTDVRQTISATILVWTAPDISPIPMRGGVSTGFREVNALLAPIFDAFKGMIVKQTLSVTAMYEGGKPFNDTHSWTTESIETKSFASSIFDVPKDYRHQFPQIGAPGR